MSINTTVKIGKDAVDITKPCDVVVALKKVQLSLHTAGVRETVRIDGEEVTFNRPNDNRLTKMIAQYERECDRLTGGKGRSRYAKRFRFSGQ